MHPNSTHIEKVTTKAVKLKVCGMNKNTATIAALQPDYLGFIFWEPSARYFEGDMPEVPTKIKRVGVFVDASLEKVEEKVNAFGLQLVQLHGKENAAFCKDLKHKLPNIGIVKAFSIKDEFDFSVLEAYEAYCDFYLFDTKGKLPGGNGYAFNWNVLKNYPSTKPYFLSGGIGITDSEAVANFLKQPEAEYCQVIDVNSKFEIEPGLKDAEKIELFRNSIAKIR